MTDRQTAVIIAQCELVKYGSPKAVHIKMSTQYMYTWKSKQDFSQIANNFVISLNIQFSNENVEQERQ